MFIAYYSPEYVKENRFVNIVDPYKDSGFWATTHGDSVQLTDLIPVEFNMLEPLYHLVIKRGIFKVRRSKPSGYYDYHIPNFEKISEIINYVEDKIY